MSRHLAALLLVAGLAFVATPAISQTPDAATIVERAVAASLNGNTLATRGMIRAAVHEQETTSDGNTEVTEYSIVYCGDRLQNARYELNPKVSVVLFNNEGWATIDGNLDTRHTAPRMAAGTVRQKVFPLVLPFSLEFEGVILGGVSEAEWDGSPAWVVSVQFSPGFFTAPSMATSWKVFFDRENHQVLGAEFYPPEEFRGPGAEGVRYRILVRKNVDGVSLSGQVLLEGIDLNGVETGHVRITKIDYSDGGAFDPTLFIHPEVLEKLDAGDVE